MTPHDARDTVPDAALDEQLSQGEARLYQRLSEFESIVVAYSGGVDSAYLAWAANRARPGQVLCVTADSASYPRRHRDIAEAIARDFHLPHEFISTAELARPEYRANPANRCYHCKTELYEHLFDENDSTLSNLLDVHVSNIRKKLGPDFIVTRRGHGYCIEG